MILTARSERAGSKGGKSDESKASIEKPSTKLLVRNIPFQVTTTDRGVGITSNYDIRRRRRRLLPFSKPLESFRLFGFPGRWQAQEITGFKSI